MRGTLQDFIAYLKTRVEPMDISIIDRLRPFLSKIIASVVVSGLAWLATRTGYADFTDARFAEVVTGAVLWLLLTLTHTVIAKKTNPGNTASAHLAKEQKMESDRMKA